MKETVGAANKERGKETPILLWCHKEKDGKLGTYTYAQISDEIQAIIHDHGMDYVKVYHDESAKMPSASVPRRLQNGEEVWLDKEPPVTWKPTDTLFSLDYPYNWGVALFKRICAYFASVPDMNGRWETIIVENRIQEKWRTSASEETFEFFLDHWEKIPDSYPDCFPNCTAEQIKQRFVDGYELKQLEQKENEKASNPTRPKLLYVEEGEVIEEFYKDSDMAQYIYNSNSPKDGFVELAYENDCGQTIHSTGIHDTATRFLARYEQFHPLFPPREKEVPKRLRQNRYVMNGEQCTAKDLWERFYRSQIDTLIRSGAENHIAALVLMMPCMETVYKLKTGEKKQDWSKTMKLFFPSSNFSDATYRQLRDFIRNGFVHDGLTKGPVGIRSGNQTPEEYSDGQQVFWEIRSETGQFNLFIIPAFFWARVRDRIDSFYEYEQWIRGRDMGPVFTINNYIEPISEEELARFRKKQ